MRIFYSFFLVCLIAACAPVEKGMGPLTGIPPSLSSDAFIAADGAHLPMQVWAAKQPSAVMVGVHGLNDYSNNFRYPGPWFAENGVTVYAYDQRGFGKAPHPGVWAGGEALRQDLKDFIALIKQRHPDLPIYVAGASMGGAVTMSAYADKAAPEVDGLILLAPAVWGWRGMNPLYKSTLWLSAHISPGIRLTADGLGVQASDNIDVLRENGRDPLFIKNTRIDVIYGAVTLMDEAYESAERLSTPVLLLYGDHDEVIPPAPIMEIADKLPGGGMFVRYENGWHMLLRDKQREVVWRDMLGWIWDQTAPLPSG